jgi:hypothetical protein
LPPLGTLELVALGGCHQKLASATQDGIRQLELLALGAASSIDYHHQRDQIIPAFKVIASHRRDFAGLGLRHPRIAVTRQIDHCQVIAHRKEVQQTRSPGRLAGTRQSLDSGERVDERALAGIGAARDGNFRDVPARTIGKRRRRSHKTRC